MKVGNTIALTVLAFVAAGCSEPDAIILRDTFDGEWEEVGRVTGYGDRNLSVCLEEYAPALSDRAASAATLNPAKFTCRASR